MHSESYWLVLTLLGGHQEGHLACKNPIPVISKGLLWGYHLTHSCSVRIIHIIHLGENSRIKKNYNKY